MEKENFISLKPFSADLAKWHLIESAEIGKRKAMLYGLATTCGDLYFVEYERRDYQLVEVYLGFGNPDQAQKAFGKACRALCAQMSKEA